MRQDLMHALSIAVVLVVLAFPRPAPGDDGALAAAMKAYESGDTGAAMTFADQALSAGGLNEIGAGRAYFYRAEGRLLSGQLSGALADYERLAELVGPNVHTATGRALAYYLLGRHEEAWNNAEVALVIGPVLVQNRVVRGLAAWKLGRTDEALDDLQAAVAFAPQRGLPQAALGVLLAALGRSDEAERHLDAARKARPNGATELTTLAMMADEGGNEARSLELFCWAAAVDPEANASLAVVVDSGLLEGRC